jgi:hypothetical protein
VPGTLLGAAGALGGERARGCGCGYECVGARMREREGVGGCGSACERVQMLVSVQLAIVE